MSKRVVTDGNTTTAKKQRIIEMQKEAMEDKVNFSLEFTTSEEKAWIHEERCNNLTLFICVVVAVLVGLVTAIICSIMGPSTVAAVIDTLIVFAVAALLRKICTPFVKMYVSKNFDPAYADLAGAQMIPMRSIGASVLLYLVTALGSCVLFLSLLV